MTRSILLLYAHPAPHRSRANKALFEAVREIEGVTAHDLYEAYPDFLIDPARERALLSAHDVLAFQHPLYWYSAPALVKEWLDLVLTHGWAYGREGRALVGKSWLTAITAGGREEAYGPNGYNRFTIAELLRPFEATAALCGMEWLVPFVVHASHLRSDEELKAAAQTYRAHIMALQRG